MSAHPLETRMAHLELFFVGAEDRSPVFVGCWTFGRFNFVADRRPLQSSLVTLSLSKGDQYLLRRKTALTKRFDEARHRLP